MLMIPIGIGINGGGVIRLFNLGSKNLQYHKDFLMLSIESTYCPWILPWLRNVGTGYARNIKLSGGWYISPDNIRIRETQSSLLQQRSAKWH